MKANLVLFDFMLNLIQSHTVYLCTLNPSNGNYIQSRLHLWISGKLLENKIFPLKRSSIFAAWFEVSIPSYFRIAVSQKQCPRLFFSHLIFIYVRLKRHTRSTVQLVNVCNRCLKLSEYQMCFITLHSKFLYIQYLVWISVRAGTEGPQGPSGEQVTGMKGCLSHKNGVMGGGGQIKRDLKNDLNDDKPRERGRQTINNIFTTLVVFSTLLHY